MQYFSRCATAFSDDGTTVCGLNYEATPYFSLFASVVLHKNEPRALFSEVSKSRAIPTTRLESTLSHCRHQLSRLAPCCASFLSFFLKQQQHLSRAQLWLSLLGFHTAQDATGSLTRNGGGAAADCCRFPHS